MPIAIGLIGIAVVFAVLAHLNLLPCAWTDLCAEMARRDMVIHEDRHRTLLPIEADERKQMLPVTIKEREAAIEHRYRAPVAPSEPAVSEEPETATEPEATSGDEPEAAVEDEPQNVADDESSTETETDQTSVDPDEDCDEEGRTILVPRYRSAIGPVESVAPGHAYRPAYPSQGFARPSQGFARPGYGLARPN